MRSAKVNIHYVQKEGKRFEGEYYLNENSLLSMRIETGAYETKELGELAAVFNPPVFKRQFCRNTPQSVPYFQSSDVSSASETSPIFVFKGQAESLNLLVRKDDILVTGFGTIGDTRLVSRYQDGTCYANNVCRVRSLNAIPSGYIYAFLSSKYGRAQLNKNASGSVVRYIEAPGIKHTLIPVFSESFILDVSSLIDECAKLREEAFSIQDKAYRSLLRESCLVESEPCLEEYDFYGQRPFQRSGSTYKINIHSLSSISINAFNYSARIAKLKERINRTVQTKPLIECIDSRGLFSTGSFPRTEVKPGFGIELINQRDIFDSVIRGKNISRRGVNTDSLVEENEIIIAGVGTLGESETFCRCVYANNYLAGKLISGEFIRMKSSSHVPSGYLFTWLSSPYGFRLIRNTQAGTKLCRPVPKLLEMLPVPILSSSQMGLIHEMVITAQSKLALAARKEIKAISMFEDRIEGKNS